MARKNPKPFQQTAIQSGLALFTECKRLLDEAPDDATRRGIAIGQHGSILLEAPTGAGKTLVAGHLVEKFCETENVVWFWFAPFKGVVGQTAASLREELPGLRLRELSEDRNAADSRTGDVWVTTWQTVATKVKDKRNVHRLGEANLTVEQLVRGLRDAGLRIGVVVDEAHHGFFGKGTATQAMEFFRNTLRPEYTVLITATPDDRDVQRFEGELKLGKLNRVSISRREPLEEGLIKEGVKCIAYIAPPEQAALVDFEATALREAVAVHRAVKGELERLAVNLTPLMLVQVDSTKGSVEAAVERLKALGFNADKIAVHTAEEPDAGLLALANDESREVLVFKMAVALGFDAPRAGILVSMRAARDEDFGVQLVGRILRVHRKLQSRAKAGTLPELLKHGYVFLADATSQEGLDKAGQRINAMRTEYARVSPTTTVTRFGGTRQVQLVGPDGQTHLFRLEPAATGGDSAEAGVTTETITDETTGWRATIVDLLGGYSAAPEAGARVEETAPAFLRKHRYPIRAGVPRRFKSEFISPDNEATEEDCAHRFLVSAEELLRAMVAKVQVQAKEQQIFTGQVEMKFVNAEMDPERAAMLAHKALTKSDVFDPRELRLALIRRIEATVRHYGNDALAADGDKLRAIVDVILATHPKLLFDAQKAAIAEHFIIEDAEEEIPESLESDDPLGTSRLNAYGALPAGLNGWEKEFAGVLDADSQNVIQWWHRNLPHKPWSVQVLLSTGRPFFPDFVIGVNGRKTELGVLLADPKYAFETSDELPKTYAKHQAYGRVLIISQKGSSQWMTVRYNEKQNRAEFGEPFRVVDTPGW